MKILMVSMVSIHFTRWVSQLKDSGHEIYWFDPLDGTYENKNLNWIQYCKQWRLRWNFPGRYFVKNKIPWLYKHIKRIIERPVAEAFEAYLNEVKPDVVHSFVMYMSCAPILSVMQKNKHVKWIYSAWGNDLYFYQNDPKRLLEIKSCLPHIDYMFADCDRDFTIAKKYGFKGKYLGTYPTGGGYDFEKYSIYIKPFAKRKTILIKGYEHKFGRCNKVLEAVSTIKNELEAFDIIVFGANQRVVDFVNKIGLNNCDNLIVHKQLNHEDILKLLGDSIIYIGNSISDGMPNTLLEAVIMGAFPIQSNPGGATEEIIKHRKNGLLIQNPLDSDLIAKLLVDALTNRPMLEKAFEYNLELSKKLEFETIKNQVLKAYNRISIT